jgi:vacuolar protein sorting-associated protein 13A/C
MYLPDKPKQEKQDTFAEKLATNIIKNLQVEVSNLHIRYEDRFTNPEKPVSIGVTLRGLSFQVKSGKYLCVRIFFEFSGILLMYNLLLENMCSFYHICVEKAPCFTTQ